MTIDFLQSVAGMRLLEDAMTAYPDGDPLALVSRMRAAHPELSADRITAAVNQTALRQRAVVKFGSSASSMFFTSAGLEQATHPAVASYRARSALAAGWTGRLLDLCCGIGADLIAFAAAGFAVTGVDADPATADVAAANLRAMDLPGEVVTNLAEKTDATGFDVVFADPARRRGADRVFDPRSFSPGWDFVTSLLCGSLTSPGSLVVVKLAPGLDHALIPPEVAAEWISLDGDLRELCLWAPALDPARRRATVLRTLGAPYSTSDEDTPAEPPPVREVGDFLYEPDAAVVRAHLVTNVAAAVDGWLLDPNIAYVSSDRDVPTGLARRYRVVDVLPYQEKRLRSALRERDIGPLTIKKRGVSVSPETLRRRLALHGTQAATVVLTRTPRSAQALLVEPLD